MQVREGSPGDLGELQAVFDEAGLAYQPTADEIPTYWVSKERIVDLLRQLKSGVSQPYTMLFDLTAIDERTRTHREGQPPSDFTVVYHLVSLERNADIRLKVPLEGE